MLIDQLGDDITGITDRLIHGRSCHQCHDTIETQGIGAVAFTGAFSRGSTKRAQEAVLQLDSHIG